MTLSCRCETTLRPAMHDERLRGLRQHPHHRMTDPHVCTDCGQRFPVASVAAFHCGKYQPPDKRVADSGRTSGRQ